MKELYPYGQCHICNGEISIPGLEAFLCGGQCARWIKRERTGWTQIEASPARQTVTRPKKAVTRKASSLSVNQPSLLEQRGGR